MRNFRLQRIKDESGVSGTGIVAEGVLFSNGKCALAWVTQYQSVAVYDSIEELESIHGHGGLTVVVWEEDHLVNFDRKTDTKTETETIQIEYLGSTFDFLVPQGIKYDVVFDEANKSCTLKTSESEVIKPVETRKMRDYTLADYVKEQEQVK